MRIEGLIFAGLTVFFVIVATAYGVLSREPVGTTALILTSALSALISFYLLFLAGRIDPRPEDDPQADIEDGAGEYGFYSPHSWWPLPVALSAAITALGFVFGLWLVGLGAVLLLMSAVGFVFEYYRGYHIQG